MPSVHVQLLSHRKDGSLPIPTTPVPANPTHHQPSCRAKTGRPGILATLGHWAPLSQNLRDTTGAESTGDKCVSNLASDSAHDRPAIGSPRPAPLPFSKIDLPQKFQLLTSAPSRTTRVIII